MSAVNIRGLEVCVLRGEGQIGGNLISVSCQGTNILLDAGEELEGERGVPPQAAPLTEQNGFDAIFITHYHWDHLGLAYEASPSIPLYIGRKAWEIRFAADRYMGRSPLYPAGFLDDSHPIQIGSLTITPYLCDHSAFDSYMLLVEGGGASLLYTGDFRSHGRKSFSALLAKLPEQVDCLICEGTILSRPDAACWSERELEQRAVDILSDTEGPAFALLSATNLDRVVTFYRAAKRTQRLFLEDLYLAEVTSAAGGSIPHPGKFSDVRVFLPRGYSEEHPRYQRFCAYGAAKIGIDHITPKSLICIRPSMLPWLRRLSEQLPFKAGVLFYSMWSGYREHSDMSEFLSACREMGLKERVLHTSGHAGAETLKELIRRLEPQTILPVHTLCPEWFEQGR